MSNKSKCPKCGKNNYQFGVRQDDDAKCLSVKCGYSGKYSKLFYNGNGESSLYLQDEYDDEKYIDARKDIIFAKGGDGTILRAINKFKYLNKPFYGIAAGTENFLMNNTSEYCDNAEHKVFALIKVKVTSIKKVQNLSYYEEREHIEEFQAFNEIFISEENGWIEFDCHDKDYILGKFKGSGLIISTPQGSTGINKNNGGVILPLSSKDWSITGDKTNRKINYVLEQKKMSISVNSRGKVNLFIDGRNNKISNVLKVEISRGDEVTIIFNDYNDFKRNRRL